MVRMSQMNVQVLSRMNVHLRMHIKKQEDDRNIAESQ